MVIVGLALLGALIVVAILVGARLILGRKERVEWRPLLSWAALLFVANVIGDLLLLYFAMPAVTGPYGGWQWILWPLIISGAVSILFSGALAGQRLAQDFSSGSILRRMGGGRVVTPEPPSLSAIIAQGAGTAGVVAIIVALFVALILNSGITIATTWFDPNAQALAAIPHVTTMPTSARLPPTDFTHLVLVTQGIAAFKGQQVLAQNGQNYGSKYHLTESEYTLQSVQGHLYWIAPLVYNNIFANLGNYDTPGFVAVDAENPDATPKLYNTYHMRYVPDALLNQDLVRHVYLSGYVNGDLMDPTLEVNDSWQPYFTISLMQPSRGFTGEVLKRVLLVDPQTGAIQDFAPQDVPSWVDRVVPASVVEDYLGWWGLYHAAPWFNPSGAGQQKPASATPELVYNTADQPVWLVPMTSSAASDSSSTGIMLFDTKKNDASFYQISGLGVGSNVQSTFESNPKNIRAYQVDSLQLYSIYGVPTWVAIFTQPNSFGATFQAVGMVSATDLNPANVQMESSRDQVLADYSQWLATHATGGTVAQKQVSGVVARISAVTQNGTSVFYMTLQGDTRIYEIPLSVSATLPLVRPGDTITGAYDDAGTNAQVQTLTEFTDPTVQPVAATPGATTTPSATATPTGP